VTGAAGAGVAGGVAAGCGLLRCGDGAGAAVGVTDPVPPPAEGVEGFGGGGARCRNLMSPNAGSSICKSTLSNRIVKYRSSVGWLRNAHTH